jgi:hypothetical protein
MTITREPKVGGSLSEVGLVKSVRPYLINKLKERGMECGSSVKVLA